MRFVIPLYALLAAAPALADSADDRATAAFSAAFSDACTAAFLEDGNLVEPPQRYEVTSASSYDAPAAMVIWQFRCNIGAYNVQSVFMGQSEMNGIVPLMVARPDLDVVLEDPENFEGPVKEVKIVGWSASPFVVNAEFDPAKGELRETGLWRGIGDASNLGIWHLVDESLRLVRYDVDATYDGQVNPATLVSFE